ncbi:putative GDP-mannose 4,6-dehydratase [Seiridium cardinale]|uniref:GDP-mannose 4,6-dehydratase n=1 Tax=Seiridium cardinale TaxID=138064 RepID=A0ABR2XPI0_9PEZI
MTLKGTLGARQASNIALNGINKSALVIGADGQDGSYLAQLLLRQGYVVHGLVRHHSEVHSEKPSPRLSSATIHYHYGDMLDPFCLLKILRAADPDEIYYLAAQSHVGLSFSTSTYTSDVDALGTLHVLEAIIALGLEKKVRFYNIRPQYHTSEVFGEVKEQVQNENTPFNLRSP